MFCGVFHGAFPLESRSIEPTPVLRSWLVHGRCSGYYILLRISCSHLHVDLVDFWLSRHRRRVIDLSKNDQRPLHDNRYHNQVDLLTRGRRHDRGLGVSFLGTVVLSSTPTSPSIIHLLRRTSFSIPITPSILCLKIPFSRKSVEGGLVNDSPGWFQSRGLLGGSLQRDGKRTESTTNVSSKTLLCTGRSAELYCTGILRAISEWILVGCVRTIN